MSARDRWGTALLVGGAICGVVLAAVRLVHGADAAPLDADAVAIVDGRPISRARYERALEAVATDRRGGTLLPGDRRRVLERLVDEELLVGRAIELGLPASDPAVRADLVRSMIEAIEASAAGEAPDEAALRAFHAAEAWRFRGSPRSTIEHAWFSDDREGAEARARAAAASDGPLAGDPPPLPLPAGPLAMRTLTQRLGPTAARGVAELEVGATGGPWRARGGWHVARLVARHEGEVAPFEEIAEHVREEHRRVRAEAALRAFLDERREASQVVVREPS